MARAQVRTDKKTGLVNYQTQHRANLMHQPAKVTQRVSIMEHFWIDPISVTNRSTHIHQSQHNRGRKGQTDLGNIVGGNIHHIRGIKQINTIRGGRVLGSFSPQSLFGRCRFGSACSADGEEKPSVY